MKYPLLKQNPTPKEKEITTYKTLLKPTVLHGSMYGPLTTG